MAYSFKSSINFGLVYIPIELHNTVKNNDISFNQIDKKTMSRVKYIKTCVDCDERVVKNEDIVKGYEYEHGKYVIFDDDDFDKIKTKRDKSIKITQFTDINEIDPLYFDKPYYVNSVGGDEAFKLLLTAMERENKAGIAKAVLGNKETLIAIRAKDGEMLLNTLFFSEEVRPNPSGKTEANVNENELKMATAIIEAMTAPFEPDKYRDEYRKKLEEAIELKIAGKEISELGKDNTDNSASSLMDALKSSLEKLNSNEKGKKDIIKTKAKSEKKQNE